MDQFRIESESFDREVRREASELIRQGYFPYEALGKAVDIVRQRRQQDAFRVGAESNSSARRKE